MRVDVRKHDEVVIVDLQGKLVAGVGDVLLRDVMNELLAEAWRKILLDLSQVSTIDSSGVGELVASRKIAQRFGADLKILRPTGGVDRVLRMSQILPLFDVHDDEESAFEAFSAGSESEETA